MDRNKKGTGQSFDGTLGDSAARARYQGVQFPTLGARMDSYQGSSAYNPKGMGQMLPGAQKGMGTSFQPPMGGGMKGPGQPMQAPKGNGMMFNKSLIGQGDSPWMAAFRTLMNRHRGGW